MDEVYQFCPKCGQPFRPVYHLTNPYSNEGEMEMVRQACKKCGLKIQGNTISQLDGMTMEFNVSDNHLRK